MTNLCVHAIGIASYVSPLGTVDGFRQFIGFSRSIRVGCDHYRQALASLSAALLDDGELA